VRTQSLHLALLALALSLSACDSRSASPTTDTIALATRSLDVPGHRIALVIGNDNYEHVTPLHNARADARAVRAALKSVGFDVTLEEDVDLQRLKTALRTFKGKISGGDQVVFYFSGHGVQFEGTNYLIPTDLVAQSAEQVMDDAVPLQRVLDDMKEVKARFALAIVDACRDNPFKGTGRAIGGRGLAPVTAASGEMVMYSAGAGQEALDRLGPQDADPNGVFTRVLIREIRNPGVPADQVLKHVKTQVVALAEGVHHEQVPALYDQSLGEFYFVPPVPAAPVPPPPPHPVPVPPSPDPEQSFWNRIKDSTELADFKDYQKQFPNGAHAGEAALMIRKLPRNRPVVGPVLGAPSALTFLASNDRARGGDAAASPGSVLPAAAAPGSAPERAPRSSAAPGSRSANVAPGTFGGYATSSLNPGTQLRGRMVLQSNGDFEYRGDNGVKVSGNLDLSNPGNVTGTGVVAQPRVLGVPLMRYPDGSTSTQMTLRGKIVNGKLQAQFTDPFEKGELVFDLANRL
jgi:hypothetical protein